MVEVGTVSTHYSQGLSFNDGLEGCLLHSAYMYNSKCENANGATWPWL